MPYYVLSDLAGTSPLPGEEAYHAPRAFEERDDECEPDGVAWGERVAVQLAEVVGITEPADAPADDDANVGVGRPVWMHYGLPAVVGRPVPWVDAGGRREYAKLSKQEQSQRRWRSVHVDHIERYIEAPKGARSTGGLPATPLRGVDVDRAQADCLERLRHRYVLVTIGRPGEEVVTAPVPPVRLPRPLLANRGGRAAGARPGFRYQPRARSYRPPDPPDRVRAEGAPPSPPSPFSTNLVTDVVASDSLLRRVVATPWIRLQRALNAHREMTTALGWAPEDVRTELALAQRVVERAMAHEGLFNDSTDIDDDEDDYGYSRAVGGAPLPPSMSTLSI